MTDSLSFARGRSVQLRLVDKDELPTDVIDPHGKLEELQKIDSDVDVDLDAGLSATARGTGASSCSRRGALGVDDRDGGAKIVWQMVPASWEGVIGATVG